VKLSKPLLKKNLGWKNKKFSIDEGKNRSKFTPLFLVKTSNKIDQIFTPKRVIKFAIHSAKSLQNIPQNWGLTYGNFYRQIDA
jgi:hypothetical protein